MWKYKRRAEDHRVNRWGPASNTALCCLAVPLTFCPPLHWNWEIIWTNRFTVSAVVLPFISWEPRKTRAMERNLFNGDINTRYGHVLFHSMFFLFHSVSFFLLSCSCLLTGASSALQHATGINTVCTPEKRLLFWLLRQSTQAALSHLNMNMRHFHTRNS